MHANTQFDTQLNYNYDCKSICVLIFNVCVCASVCLSESVSGDGRPYGASDGAYDHYRGSCRLSAGRAGARRHVHRAWHAERR